MSFKIRQASTVELIADERLYLASDGKTIVPEGDPRATSLLAAAGQPIPSWAVKRLGITATPATAPAVVPVVTPATKQDNTPRANRVIDPPGKR